MAYLWVWDYLCLASYYKVMLALRWAIFEDSMGWEISWYLPTDRSAVSNSCILTLVLYFFSIFYTTPKYFGKCTVCSCSHKATASFSLFTLKILPRFTSKYPKTIKSINYGSSHLTKILSAMANTPYRGRAPVNRVESRGQANRAKGILQR